MDESGAVLWERNGTADLLGTPKTAGYRPSLGWLPAWSPFPGAAGFSLSAVEEMRRDAQVSLCLNQRMAPFALAEFDIQSDSKEVQKFVAENWMRLWGNSIGVMTESLAFGYIGAEALYEEKNGSVQIDRLKPLHPRDIKPYTYKGKLAYVRVTHIVSEKEDYVNLRSASKVSPAKGFWLAHAPRYSQWYGMSVLPPAWFPWRCKSMPDGGMEVLFKYHYKHGYSGMVVRYPNESYQESAGMPLVPARDHARQIGEQSKTGANFALPSSRDDKGNYTWALEKYGGEIRGSATGLVENIDFWDKQIQRGIGLPDDYVTHTETGGYSRSRVSQSVVLTITEISLNHFTEEIDRQLMRPLVMINYGRGANYTVKPKPLMPPDQGQGQPGQVGRVPGQEQSGQEQSGQGQQLRGNTSAMHDAGGGFQLSAGFDEGKHPRGQPDNAGQFGSGTAEKRTPQSFLSKMASLPAKAVPQAVKDKASAAGKWAKDKMEKRYGAKITKAIITAVAMSAPIPLPGSQPAVILFSLAIAEGVRAYANIRGIQLSSEFDERKHPRGQPGNPGQFGSGGGKKRGDSGKAQSSALKVKLTNKRAFNGSPVAVKNQISKQEAGKIGESAVISWLHLQGLKDAHHMNLDRSNFPIDLVQDHACIEVKTGNVANGSSAQQWRLTIGEPGKDEKAWLAKASATAKAKWNAKKQAKIHERKEKALADLSEKLGKPIKARTITCLINPDTKTIDIYKFEGWHDRIAWNSDAAKKAYAGSITYA